MQVRRRLKRGVTGVTATRPPSVVAATKKKMARMARGGGCAEEIFASSLFGMGSNDRLFRPMDVSQFG
jgi:hypothetical protein